MELVDRFRGSVVGLAIGDALGHPTEFLASVDRIRAKYGPEGIRAFAPSGYHPAGTFTDDTQMSIAVARALARAGRQSLDDLMRVMGEEFVAWAQHPSNNRAPGGTCLAGCRNLAHGAPWRQAGVKESKGCGAAMRAAPVGLYYFDDDDALVRVAAAQSTLTHAHPTGIASGVAAAAPVAWACKGKGLDGMVAYTKAMVQKLTPELLVELGSHEKDAHGLGVSEMVQILDEVEPLLGEEHEDVCQLLGGAWVGEEAVATALWCVLKASGDFDQSILRGANSSGDSDSIACIAGSIAGALQGVGAIDKRWLDGVERGADLDLLARKLHAARVEGDIPSLPPSIDFFEIDRPRHRVATVAIGRVNEDPTMDETSATGELDADADEEPPGAAPSSAGPGGSDALRAGDVPLEALGADELERAVARHNMLYWEQAAPEISDVEFDVLTRRLQQLRPHSPALAHLGPRPGAGGAVRHGTPMLSLDKCYEEAELVRWLADIGGDVLVMPKIDGLACTIRYDASGAMEVAATRGDGEVGEDITANVRAVLGVPTRLARGPLEVRGEVYLSLQAFERHKAQGKANPRNMAAGALRQKDPNQTRAAGLSFLAYDVRGVAVPTQGEKLALARELGFSVVEYEVVPVASAPAAVQRFAERRAALPYETDGVVLVADGVAEHDRLGVTAHHPRWAIAWKFQGEEGTSVLRGVEWSVARTGTITPVALVDPVALSGVTVTRATLHHKGFIEKLGLTLGATVAMVRRGGVIPHVERVLSAGSAPVELPSACPGCGAPVLVEGEFLMCSAPAGCHRARVGQLLHFVSAVDIQGLGEAIVDEAVQKGVLSSPADLYRIGAAALAALDKCGDKNGEKIAAEIDHKRVLDLDVLLRALGIEGLGKTAARTLAERYPSLARLREATAGELAAIKGFGEITAGQIVDGLRAHAALLDELLTFVQVRQAVATGDSGASAPLAGMSFVFTGALSMDRKQAEARVTRLGAKVASSVTRALTHLVLGGSERDAPSTKQKAAEKHIAEGAPIAVLSESAFEELLAGLAAPAAPAPPAPSTPMLQAPAETPLPVAPLPVAPLSEAPPDSRKKQQLTLF